MMKGFPTLQRKLNKAHFLSKHKQKSSTSTTVSWTEATWSIDGNGRAYNTPTLGSELLANGGFDSDTVWSKGTGWSIGSGVATHTGSAGLISQSVTTVGLWYFLSWAVTAVTGGNAQGRPGVNGPIRTTIASYVDTNRAIVSTAGINATADISIDNLSLKQITLPTTLATVTGITNNLTVADKINTIITGTQIGVASLIDSSSNPQNFIIAYHDGTNVRLEKCVAGIYTQLISTAVTFVSNAQIEIRRPSGNTFQLWYNGVQRGTDQTINDSGIINNTLYGMFSTYSGNLISEFTLGGVVIPFTF